MIIYGGSEGQVLATKVAKLLDEKLGQIEITKFPDGEKYVRYHDEVENEDVVVIHPMGLKPDELFIEYLLICSALKDGKAKSITTFVPYFAYARQDSRFNSGEPGSFHLVSKIIDDLGIDIKPRINQIKVEEPPKRKSGIKVASVAELVQKLKNEAKVI